MNESLIHSHRSGWGLTEREPEVSHWVRSHSRPSHAHALVTLTTVTDWVWVTDYWLIQRESWDLRWWLVSQLCIRVVPLGLVVTVVAAELVVVAPVVSVPAATKNHVSTWFHFSINNFLSNLQFIDGCATVLWPIIFHANNMAGLLRCFRWWTAGLSDAQIKQRRQEYPFTDFHRNTRSLRDARSGSPKWTGLCQLLQATS